MKNKIKSSDRPKKKHNSPAEEPKASKEALPSLDEKDLRDMALFPEENPYPVLRVRGDGTLLYANRSAAALLADWRCAVGGRVPEPLGQTVKIALSSGRNQEEMVRCDQRDISLFLVPIADHGYVNFYGRDITERNKADQALIKANDELVKAIGEAIREKNRLEAVMSALPMAVAIVDEFGGNIRSNDMYQKLWGEGERLPFTQGIGDYEQYKAWWTDTGEPVRPEEWGSARAVINGETVIGQMMEIEAFNGMRKVIMNSAAPVRDGEGRIIGSAVAIQDITDLKHAEQEALTRAAELEAMFAAQNDAVLVYDTKMTVKRVNPSFLSTYGFDPVGLNVREIIRRVSCRWEDGRPLFLENQPTYRALQGERTSGATFVITKPGGAEAVVETASSPMSLQDRIIGSVTVWHDITERKWAEKALRRSEAQYRHIFTAMSEGFAVHELILDADGKPSDYRFLEINPGFERLTGLKAESVLGKTVLEILPETEPFWIERYGRVVQTGEPDHFESFNNGLNRWYEVYAYRTDPGRFAVVFLDITRRKQAEQERKATIEFLQIVNSSQSINELTQAAINFFQRQSGCQAAGIRLRQGDDYPYYGAVGFPEEFIRLENSLCARDSKGKIVRDNIGEPIIECMCGNVIAGRFDPAKPFFTTHGSFWTNSTTRLLAAATDPERQTQTRTRNRCNEAGYESVALIPLFVGEERFGLLQVNDPQEGVFSLEIITLWERLADHLAVALAKFKAEESLRENRKDLDRAQSVGRIGSWRLNVRRNELLWSDENHRIFGIPKGTPLTYEAFLAIVHPDDRTYVDRMWKAALRGESYDIEHRIIADGTVKWVLEKAELEFDSYGELSGGFGTTQDITERKKQEEQLKVLNRTLRALGNANEAMILAENESEFLNKVCRIVVEDCEHAMVWIGYAQEDEGKNVQPVAQAGFENGYLETLKISWADTECDQGPTGIAIRTGMTNICRNMATDPRMRLWRKEAVKQGYASSISLPLIIEDRVLGALTIYSRSSDPFSDDEIELLQELATDLSFGIKVIRSRLSQRQAEDSLRQSEARFRLLSEIAEQLLKTEDPQGIVEALCRKVMEYLDCHAFFNFMADEGAGKLHLNACAGIPAEEVERIEWLEYGAAVCGCAARDGVPIVVENIPTTPDLRTELVKSYGIRAYACHPMKIQGRIIGTLSFGTKTRNSFFPEDLALMKTVTYQIATAMERMRLIEELQSYQDELETRVEERTVELKKTNKALEQSNKALEEFAYVASHDLQEPLRKIQTFADRLKTMQSFNDDKAQDYMTRMQQAAGRMRALIRDLLVYSRLAAAPEPFTLFNLKEPIEDAVKDLMVPFDENDGSITIGELPEISADKVQMGQLFRNLISNALKYHSGQKPAISVYDASSASDRFYEIHVEDNGIGFDEMHLDKIFKPFQRLHGQKGSYEGTGMGLAICRRIAERHRGSISAKSKPGKGSTFIVKLPRNSRGLAE